MKSDTGHAQNECSVRRRYGSCYGDMNAICEDGRSGWLGGWGGGRALC